MIGPEEQERRDLDAFVRGLSAAGKSLRLYPASSPIPRQSVDAAVAALEGYLAVQPVLSLAVGREGLTRAGELVSGNSPGVADLASELRAHGVAEIDFIAGCTAEDLLGFLGIVMREPAETRAEGGVATMLAAAGLDSVRAVDVLLTVIEEEEALPEGDIDDFFRQLAGDAEKLAAWLATMAKRDPSALTDGLEELVKAAGDDVDLLARNLAEAFGAQETLGKDALFGAAMEGGVPRDITGRAFECLGADALAGALAGGLYGRNMLSLSNAMSNLPIAERLSQIMEEVQRTLPQMGHSAKEADFLTHMMDVRARTEPEPSLVEADQTYATVAQLSQVSEEETQSARGEASGAKAFASAVATMLALLDQEQDCDLYKRSVESLSALVPRLVEDGDLELGAQVLRELHAREVSADKPWPELDSVLRSAIATATGKRTMAAVLRAVIADPAAEGPAREIVRLAGDGTDVALAEEALALKEEGLAAAERLVGRRIVDLLGAAAASAQWFQVAAIVSRLAREADPRSLEAVRQIASRPDEQSRREAAQGLAAAGGREAVRLLAQLTRDSSQEVAIVAVRALGKCGDASALASRLGEMDVDGKDFMLAREVIGALARVEDAAATGTLKTLAERKTLIKRGHFAEVQELARQALAYRAQRGGAA